jgi:hypothetical protein
MKFVNAAGRCPALAVPVPPMPESVRASLRYRFREGLCLETAYLYLGAQCLRAGTQIW